MFSRVVRIFLVLEMEEDEGTSEEMLQKLRNWQEEQKKRLIEQQAQQRLLLLEKQKRLLSMINCAEVGSIQEMEESGSISESYQALPHDHESPPQPVAKTPPSMDDIPLRKPRAVRSFQQMLESSLNNKGEENEPEDASGKKKFPFLKRGQGISRFGTISKPSIRKPVKKPPASKTKGKENKAPVPKVTNIKPQPLAKQKLFQQQSKDVPVTIPEPPKTVPRQATDLTSTSSLDIVPYRQPEEVVEPVNASRTEEDLAVFELLERFATINASFSSSSSLIGQLIDQGITHLPSPSKVLSFLSKRRADFNPSTSVDEDSLPNDAPAKSHRTGKHVHFAESVEDDEESQDRNGPWLSDIAQEVLLGRSHPPEPVNPPTTTVRNEQPNMINLNDTPTSPIGFPDYQKLFGNPVRSLWPSEDSTPSAIDSDPRIRLTDPDTDLRGKRHYSITISFFDVAI